MRKPLSQIAFDFLEPGEAENVQSVLPAVAAVLAPEPEIQQEPEQEPEPGHSISEPVAVFRVKPKDSVPEQRPVPGRRGRKSLKEIALHADLIQVPEDEVLFKKQYYSIGEVAAMFRENQSLIRYWETEFDILEPRKNRKGDRFFRPVDIKNLVLIYDLLRRRKFTIEGAREFLKKNKKAEEKFAAIQSLQKIRAFLLELRASL